MDNPTYSGEPGTYGAYYFIDDISVELLVDVSSIDENENNSELLTAFLDPISDVLNVNLMGQFNQSTLALYNVLGELVYSNEAIAESVVQIDMAILEIGMYVLKCENEGAVQTIKIIR
jgi:hypothetical protein